MLTTIFIKVLEQGRKTSWACIILKKHNIKIILLLTTSTIQLNSTR